MKRVRLYESFIKEAYKFYDLFFNSHLDHNPECDILEGHLDKDSLITYGIYVKGPKQGLEFMEYYSGSNYKPTSDKRSSSRLFMVDKIPAKYKAMWEDLKKIYEDEYAGSGRVSTRNESLVTEAIFKSKDFDSTLVVYKVDQKAKELYVVDVNKFLFAKKDPNSTEAPERFSGMFGMMLEDDWSKTFGDLPKIGDILPFKNEKVLESLNEAVKSINEGQFSWMTQDTGNQIGSEKENTIAVTMFDDKGNKWLERKYDGYGEFGGKDYYELLAQMNGVENAGRQDGIDIAFGKMKIKGDVLFPALIEEPNRFNFKRHDFTQEPENDPNQSWYQEPEYDDDDDDNYDDSNESKVTEAKALPLDKLTKMIGDKPSCYSLADFVYTNYDKVTGLKKSMRNDEMDFPSEIMDLVDHYGFDVDDFTDKYSMAAESLNVDEKEVNLFDEVGPELEALRSKISGLMKKSEDDKWTSALGKALTALSTLDRNLSQADSKLGVVPVNEALSKEQKMVETFLNKVAKEFDYSIQDAVRFVKETISKMGLDESKINEASMSDIDLMAQEAKDFKSFVKEFTKEYHDLSNAGEPGQFKEWLQSVYDNAKANMDESVVNEAKDVKSEVIDKLSQFFGVSTGALIKFNFDGKDDVRALTKALNGTDYEGVDNIVRVAILSAKRDLGIDEAIKPAGLSKAETKKVAETYAKAIGKNDGVKCTVNAKSLEEDSFDLDIDGEEYAGGSYIITLDGDVVNAALPEKPVYGQIDSTVDQIIKNLKK